MDYKWIGALLTVAGCGGFGFQMAAAHRYEEKSLRQLVSALDYMTCELRYRMTPLPEVCRQTSGECGGSLKQLFSQLGEELDAQLGPDVRDCMDSVLRKAGRLPDKTRANLILLGNSLGRFDLEGQLTGLEAVRAACRRDLDALGRDRDQRLRSYQTLGLCAGAALAILLV